MLLNLHQLQNPENFVNKQQVLLEIYRNSLIYNNIEQHKRSMPDNILNLKKKKENKKYVTVAHNLSII
jgi:hypothetical protein